MFHDKLLSQLGTHVFRVGDGQAFYANLIEHGTAEIKLSDNSEQISPSSCEMNKLRETQEDKVFVRCSISSYGQVQWNT